MSCRPGRRGLSDAVLKAKSSSVIEFEDFVDSLQFLSKSERDRLMLAGAEILDNIIKHSAPLRERGVRVRVALRGSSLLLAFFFQGPGFAAFAQSDWARATASPLFDPANRRWRGIGLVMCRNLARKVRFRPGSLMDRIFLEFDRTEQA